MNNKSILITGGTGFIGSKLCAILSNQGHIVTVLTRDKNKASSKQPSAIKLIDSLDDFDLPQDIIINLAGAPIAVRWTSSAIKKIQSSRFDTTQRVIDFIARMEQKPQSLISGSAIGYYGNSTIEQFTENSDPAETGFTHQLCHKWEEIAQQAQDYGVRVCLLRTGIVLRRGGGVIKQLWNPFSLGLGGKIGSGEQMMSWIHMEDLINIILRLVNDNEISGPINATAPEPVTNARFSTAFADSLGKPSFLTTPSLVLRLLYGEMAQKLLIEGQSVLPERLDELGYQFKYSQVEEALSAICEQ